MRTIILASSMIAFIAVPALADPTRGVAVGGSYNDKGSGRTAGCSGCKQAGESWDQWDKRTRSGSRSNPADTTSRNNDKTTCGTKC